MQRLIALALLLISSLAGAEVIDIDNARLEQLLKQGVPVVDIRTQPEWEETGIVPGSRLLTFFDERGRYDAEGWLGKVKSIARPNEPLIIICRSGNRTRPVSQLLSRQAGYATVYNVKSGIRNWIDGGKPVIPARDALAACKATRSC